jgi:tRNA A37 threonylcarbamoyladenosine dehydratase
LSESGDYNLRFGGIERLHGKAAAARLRAARVCVVGLGGVGSWTAEALARTGVGALTLVDLDEVCVSNVNRQLPALTSTIGRSKVSVMKERVLGINPDCVVEAREEFFTRSTADPLFSRSFDCVVDAIDSVSSKCLLIARCRQAYIPIVTAVAVRIRPGLK